MRADERWCCSAGHRRVRRRLQGPDGSWRVRQERVRNTPIIESGAWAATLGLALTASTHGWRCSSATSSAAASTVVTIWPPPTTAGGAGAVSSSGASAADGPGGSLPTSRLLANCRACGSWPRTPGRRQGLLAGGLRRPEPGAVLEHKALYRPSGAGAGRLAHRGFGEAGCPARPRRHGLTTGSGAVALEAAGILATTAPRRRVIDLRTLRPWDSATVLASVERTGRRWSSRGPQTGGFGARSPPSSGSSLRHLDGPRRAGRSTDTPVPFSRRSKLCTPPGPPPPALRSLLAY